MSAAPMHPDFDDALLGRDAPLFFGLNSGWTETDLKRAYTTLIRRWKPEKFPEEFKRLRAVYETLRAAGPSAPAIPSAPSDETSEVPAKPVEDSGTASTPTPAIPIVTGDARTTSAILREESREEARRILEERGLRAVPDALALAHLRAPAGSAWPGVCLNTLAEAIMRADEGTDASSLVAAVERALAGAPKDDFRAALDAFAPFEEFGAYFDVTADLWIGFSKKEPEACLMRLDRLLHFTKVGHSGRHALFLLRFGIAGAFRLPLPWLREQARHLGSLHGLNDAATPRNGRLASHGPLGACARHVGHEMDHFEALLKVREDLESPALASHPMTTRYRALLAAFADNDPELCLTEWKRIAGTRVDTFTPWVKNPQFAYKVMWRVREGLDPVITIPDAPAVPKGGALAKLAVTALHFTANTGIVFGTLFLFVGICRLNAALLDELVRRAGMSEALEGLLLLGVPVGAAIGAWFGFKKLNERHRLFFRLRRLILAPLIAATRDGHVDFDGIHQFLSTGVFASLANHLGQDEALLYRIRVFRGTRR